MQKKLQQNTRKFLWLFFAVMFFAFPAHAWEHHGQVVFGASPVPGATITAMQGDRKISTVSDQQGRYSFTDLAEGAWKIHIEMQCFASIDQTISAAPDKTGILWELKLLPIDQIIAQTKIVKVAPKPVIPDAAQAKTDAPKPADAAEMPRHAEESSQANDGFLVNGSVNNAATSQFTLASAFGNSRRGSKSLYTGGISMILDNSALDARPYSLSGDDTPKSAYNKVTMVASFGGPLHIPHLMPRGPNFFIVYQWTRDRIATAQSALVPTQDQRDGILSTGTIPVDQRAQALLALYPLPNIVGNTGYNYQIPILNNSHEDVLQTRLDKTIGRRDEIYGRFGFQSTRADSSNLFKFRDTTDTLGINTNVNWNHRFNHGFYFNAGYRFSRSRIQVAPYFANRVNVSGMAGITGNNQDPINWGPPSLIFSSGLASLSDGQSSFNRNRTDELTLSLDWYRGRHNISFGGDFRRQEFNYLSQQNPRGTFTFTGEETGVSDLADFLTGVPHTSAISYGNADKYLRQSVYNAYVTDDWRIRPELTINAGVRWEYGAPITELKGRMANLDVAPGFTAVRPVLGSSPIGPLTGQHYPNSLLRPDRLGIEPRIGISWRPIPGSSLVVRAGYGVYSDTSVYQATALNLAQQSPLSTSLSVQNSAACPQTLASGFNPCSLTTSNTFAVDPNFRVGYAQTWQLAIQRDLPAALQMTATYLGIKGTRGVQEFLPNTYPLGATNPCPSCPTGFVYRTSNGNSTRESGSLQLRRRLRSGFTASLLYTYSKSIDNDSVLGGQGAATSEGSSQSAGYAVTAQDWLNLRGERGLSSFDQRHLLNTNIQYTSGMGLGGGTLLGGWRGRALKEWTVLGQIVVGSGLPETPIFLAAVNGTGFTGSIRPDRTSAPLYSGAAAGHFLNEAAYTAPQPGHWGNAGKGSITGPGQFTFNASLSRTFRIDKRYSLDVRVDSTNLLNHGVFTAWNATVSPTLENPLFGLPTAANPMRSLQTTARLRF